MVAMLCAVAATGPSKAMRRLPTVNARGARITGGPRRLHTWLRLRATKYSLKNDSVWLQFSDSVNKTGVATYRIGGVSGLPIALEPCSGCAVSGWGWQSRGWWVADTGDVYFPTTGAKTLRIQTRE